MKRQIKPEELTTIQLSKPIRFWKRLDNFIGYDYLDAIGVLVDKHGLVEGLVVTNEHGVDSFKGDDYIEICEGYSTGKKYTKAEIAKNTQSYQEAIAGYTIKAKPKKKPKAKR